MKRNLILNLTQKTPEEILQIFQAVILAKQFLKTRNLNLIISKRKPKHQELIYNFKKER